MKEYYDDKFSYELENGDYTAARGVCEMFSAEEDRDDAEGLAARLFALLVA